MNQVICIFIVSILCMISTVGVCELTPIEVGQQDAKRDVPQQKWFIEGCFNGCIFTWVAGGNQVTKASKIPPEVVTENVPNLLGKPPEYIEKYVNAYQAETVNIQSRWADYGLWTGASLTSAIIFAYLIGRLE